MPCCVFCFEYSSKEGFLAINLIVGTSWWFHWTRPKVPTQELYPTQADNGLVTTELTLEWLGQQACRVIVLLFPGLAPISLPQVPPAISTSQPLCRSAFSSPRVCGCGLLPLQTLRGIQCNLAWIRKARGTWRTIGTSEGLGYQFWNLNKLQSLVQKDPSHGVKSCQCAGKTNLEITNL